jgi:CDP-glycerol glycerophosphotransferase (TagB/SpsB family)
MRYLLYADQNYAFQILRPLQSEILARGGEAAWLLAGNSVSARHIRDGEILLDDAARAVEWKPDAVLVPGNMAPAFLPGIKVGVFHGFNVAKSTRGQARGHFNIRDCFDLYCTQGPSTTEPFRRLAAERGHFEVVETGWPTLDPLFGGSPPARPDDRPRIMLCSTFTKSLSCAPHLFDTVRRLSRTGRWHWTVQFHPKMDRRICEAYRALQGDHLEYVETDDVIPYLQRADAMVCDTSSVMYMFMAQNRPVVTFRNNSAGERAHLLDVRDPSALESAVETALMRPAALMRNIDAWLAKTHPYRDGRSAARVIDAVETYRAAPPALRPKPFNLLRNLKERAKLGYWRP